MSRLIAKVALQGITGSADRLYSYYVTNEFADSVYVGSRVIIPFGISNKKYRGIIFELIVEDETQTLKIKPIYSLIENEQLLTEEFIDLARFIKNRYFCGYYDAVKLMLPSAVNVNINEKLSIIGDLQEKCPPLEEEIYNYIKNNDGVLKTNLLKLFKPQAKTVLSVLEKAGTISVNSTLKRKLSDKTIKMTALINNSADDKKFANPKWHEVIELLKEKGDMSDKEIMYLSGVKSGTLSSMERRGFIRFYEEISYRRPLIRATQTNEKIQLTASQNEAYEQLKSSEKLTSLLFGVTGSGKTHIFLKLTEDMQNEGKGVIILVPEISLTSQMINKFYECFGDRVAIIHSALSQGERFDEWKRIKINQAQIVIGTRSAVFAPVQDLGLIIIDEEQEHTYKSEMTPRYNAREVARYRSNKSGARLILSSATPSIESFYLADSGKYQLVELKQRYNKSQLPDVTIVDMRTELRAGNTGVFSVKLQDEMNNCLQKEQQIMLFINRRGYNSFVSCRSCGYVSRCPNCDISLTYHSKNNRLMCHYCGYNIDNYLVCPECKESHIRYFGSGTQKVEQELQNLFPDAKIARMDADTTMRKSSHDNIITDFSKGMYDILVGTQMITKGLDFSNVTLAAVISADMGLYNGEFKANEKSFSLLTQLSGRAGRGESKGKAIIQTYTPDNPVLNFAVTQDFKRFYDNEIIYRRSLLYPPFCDICQVLFEGKNEDETSRCADMFTQRMKEMLAGYENIPVKAFGPAAAQIPKINNLYRYKLLLKCKATNSFTRFMGELIAEFSDRKTERDVYVTLDLNPESIQ